MNISVIIPTHNRIDELKIALKSVYTQTVLPHEIIIVDDGSSPRVPDDIFNKIPSKINYCLLRNETPQGASKARNRGITKANGEWIAFLDDDDKFKPEKIEIVSDAISNNCDADLFYHIAEIHIVNEGIVYFSRKSTKKKKDPFRELLIINYVGGTPMVVVKKTSLIEVGCFAEDIHSAEDYELWLRMAKNNKKFYLINLPLTECHYMTVVTRRKNLFSNLDSFYQGKKMIEKIYHCDYQKLSLKEKKQYFLHKKMGLIHRLLLTNQWRAAIKEQLRVVLMVPSFYSIIVLLSLCLGTKNVFRLRAWVNWIESGRSKISSKASPTDIRNQIYNT
ncbi:MAG: glycosyltransferase family 2 protein [Candidatus Electrothrix sp. LOE1_4_5]|nr:glycosyltransferase family 2 protein [Candidatus Electrothrix gigas]